MTLGERLKVLQAKMEKPDSSEKHKRGSLSASTAAVLVHQINQRYPLAMVAKCLTEWRDSGDMELYNRAMRLPNDIVIGTAKQLSAHDATKFLRLCVDRLQIRPKDALSVVNWIRAIVKTHAATLMSTPDIQQCISRVHQVTPL